MPAKERADGYLDSPPACSIVVQSPAAWLISCCLVNQWVMWFFTCCLVNQRVMLPCV